MIRSISLLAGGLAALCLAPPAQAAQCVSDAEIEAAVGDQIRGGAFAVSAGKLEGRPLCSGVTLTQAIQKLRAQYFPEAAPAPRRRVLAATPPPPAIDRRRIVGAWVAKGETCESDAGITYDADGSWSTMEESGDWTLAGQSLTLVTRERHEDGASEMLRTPERDTSRIELIGDTGMRQRSDDGSMIVLDKCPDFDDAPAPAQPAANDAASDAVAASEVCGARAGMRYSEVRKRIIAAGFRPEPRPKDQFCGYESACKLPETDACAGTGEGQCSYNFNKGARRIYVVGIGDPGDDPQGQQVTSIMNWHD